MKDILFLAVLSIIIFFIIYYVIGRDIGMSLMLSIGFFLLFSLYPFLKRKIDEMSK